MVGIGVVAAAAWVISVYDSAPSLANLEPITKGAVSKVYAADGSLIGVIHSDKIRQPISSARMPQDLKDATVAIEDRRFYSHGGIDPSAIVRAGWEDLLAGGKPVQGGSTITQQLVRNLYISDPQDTLKRKIIEAHLANDEENQHSKDWILTKYLNTAPYGTNEGATAIGVEAAAETYYSKHARDLTLPEAAMIAGLPQAPSEYNPLLDPRAALARRNEVLHAMEQQGKISSSDYQDALGQGLGLNPGQKYNRIRQPYIFDLVQQELRTATGSTRSRTAASRSTRRSSRASSRRRRKRSTPARSATRAGVRRRRSPRSTPRTARSSPSPRPSATRRTASSTSPGRPSASPAPRSRPTS